MKFNQLPEGHDGPQKRLTEFESLEAKLTCDAKNLIAKAELQSKIDKTIVDPIDLAQRCDDDFEALQLAIDKEQGTITSDVAAVMAEVAWLGVESTPEQRWLGRLKIRFMALPKLHEGIAWADVERSLKADPESMGKLQALDAQGHQMNVFGEDGDTFVFVSAWCNREHVAPGHKNIVYDREGQELVEEQGHQPNGNAVTIIAEIMGVEEEEAGKYLADPKFHEQLRGLVAVYGWAWLKTDAATRASGLAFGGVEDGIRRGNAGARSVRGSFRAELRVKKA